MAGVPRSSQQDPPGGSPAAHREEKLTREEKKAQTRERLLDAAAKVFARRGFAGASLEDVAVEAGLTKGAVYSNFSSKDDLITALIDERVDDPLSAIPGAVAGEASAHDQAFQAADLFLGAVEHNRDAWLLMFEYAIYQARRPELRRPISPHFLTQRAEMAELLEGGASRRGVALPMPADELMLGLSALGQGIALARLRDPDAVPHDLFARMLVALIPEIPGRADDPAVSPDHVSPVDDRPADNQSAAHRPDADQTA